MTLALNILLYQTGWFCCVLGAAYGYPLGGALGALMLTAIHVALSVDRVAELRLILSACLIGVVIDSSQQALGVLSFRSDPRWPLWLPLWVFVIWAQLATLLHYALAWLQGRYFLAALLGLVGGPLAYWAGIRLGAGTLGSNRYFSFGMLALCWALVTPLLVYLARSSKPSRVPARYRIL